MKRKMILSALMVTGAAITAFAQDAASAVSNAATNLAASPAVQVPAAHAADSQGPIAAFMEFTRMGGIFMWPLYLLSILGLAYTLERFFAYNLSKIKIIDPLLVAMCKTKEACTDVTERIKAFPSRMGNVLGEIIRLSKKRNTVEELDKVLEMGVNMELSELQKSFTMISAIINLAPLIGFLGTVSGMIDAFRTISRTDQVSMTLVAKGIYEALITTEVGLVIAIIMNFFYSLFVQKVERFTQQTIDAGENLIERIVENED